MRSTASTDLHCGGSGGAPSPSIDFIDGVKWRLAQPNTSNAE